MKAQKHQPVLSLAIRNRFESWIFKIFLKIPEKLDGTPSNIGKVRECLPSPAEALSMGFKEAFRLSEKWG